jgi:hypothetical protein
MRNIGFVWNREKDSVAVHMSFTSPTSVLGFQFFHELFGNKKYQRCEGCGRWFELAPGVNQANRLTCSTSCRVTVYRRRKQRARELHEQGESLKKISAVIGSDVPTIKKWLTQKGK